MRLRPYLVIFILWLLYLHPLVLHPAQTVVSPYSDFLAEHLPAKLFLNREWRETGELPLWNPYHFCGSPFVHDIQVGIFYPPNAVVYFVPEGGVGAALSWVVALHVLAAGVFAYFYARSRDLNEVGSLVAAVGFMLSSKWMTHLFLAGHTITIGLAWLPLVLLTMERGIAARRAWPVLSAGAALAMLGLGTHPQWAFYAGVFALAWTLPPERGALIRWIACWGGAAVVAALLTAVQVLPTVEASQWSARSAGVEASGTLTVGVGSFFHLVGPSASRSIEAWEIQGVFGLFWLGAAAATPLLATGRAKFQFGVLCGLLVFAVGGAILVNWLPGFNLFRLPARMLLVVAFPLAYLAGVATDAVTRAEWSHQSRLDLSRGFRRAVLFAGLPTVFGLVVFPIGEIGLPFVIYCVALLVSLALFVRTLQQKATSPLVRTVIWLGILLVELAAPALTLPSVRPQGELYPGSPMMNVLASHPRPESVRVLDWDTGPIDARGSFLGVGAPQSMAHRVESPRGYNPLDVRHYREFIAFVVNTNEPIRGNGPFTQQVLPNFEVGNQNLFRLLCTTHRVAPTDAPPLPGEWKLLLHDDSPPTPPPLLPGIPNPLPPHTLAEAVNPQPRAWIVPRAEPLTADPLEALRVNDFSQTVLITSGNALPPSNGTQPGTARIAEYRPNRVSVELDGRGGWLVLSEVWYPGWACRVDGAEVPVYRANHAFRAAPLPAGAKRAEFVFAPRSYLVGWWVSVISAGALALACLGGLIHRAITSRAR